MNKEVDFQKHILGRKPHLSKLLVGKLKDTDKDGYPDIMDCNPYNPNEHGRFSRWVKRTFTRKKPTTTITSVKPTTTNIRSVDYGTSTQDRVGGTTTITTTTPSSGGGGSGGGGGGSSITSVKVVGRVPESDIQKAKQTQQIQKTSQLTAQQRGVEKLGGGVSTVGVQKSGVSTPASPYDKDTGLDKFGRTQSYYDQFKKQQEYRRELGAYAQREVEGYQQLYERGQLSYEEAQKKLEENVLRKNQELVKKYSDGEIKQDTGVSVEEVPPSGFKRFTRAFLDVPFATGTIGSTAKAGFGPIKDVPFTPYSTIGETIKEFPSTISSVPIATPDIRKGGIFGGGGEFRLSTIGAESRKISEGLEKAGEFVGEGVGGYLEAESKLKRKLPGVPGVMPEPFLRTQRELTANIAGMSPQLISWGLAPYAMGTIESLSLAERGRTVDRDTQVELRKQFVEYQKDDTPVPEGYRKLTREEFFEQEPVYVKSELKKGIGKNALILTGFVVGGSALFAGLKYLPRLFGKNLTKTTNFIRKYAKIKPRISQSVTITNAVKVAENTWRVDAEVVTFLRDPKTGKLIDKKFTETVSTVVNARNQEGAIKSLAKTEGATWGKYGTRRYKKDDKVTQTRDVSKAEGTFTYTKEGKGFRGTGESFIYDQGKFKFRLTPKEMSVNFVPYNVKPESIGLSNIGLIPGKPTIKEIPFGGGRLQAQSQPALSWIESNVARQTMRVRGYSRPPMDYIIGRQMGTIKKIGQINYQARPRVKPYLRRFPKEQIGTSGKTLSFSESFSRFRFIPKEVPSVRLPKPPKPPKTFDAFPEVKAQPKPKPGKPGSLPTSQLKTEPVPKLKSETVARTSAEAQAKELALSQVPSKIRVFRGTSKIQKGLIEEGTLSRFITSSKPLTRTGMKEPQVVSPIFDAKLDSYNLVTPTESTAQDSGTTQVPILTQTTDVPTEFVPMVYTPTYEVPKRKREPIKEKEKIRPIEIPEIKRPQYVKGEGYDAYVLREATSRSKRGYVKINTRPLTKESALSAMSREVDSSISARGKVEKIPEIVEKVRNAAGKIVGKKKKFIKVMDTKDKYWKMNKRKFRNFSTKKKKPLKSGVYIERQRYRLDSPREKRQIQIRRKGVGGFFGLK